MADDRTTASSRLSLKENATLTESYLHWYKKHPNTINRTTERILTEELETEAALEQYSSNACCSCCRSTYKTCYQDLKHIRQFREKTQVIFESVYRHLRWIDLPGGQDLHALDRNYWMHYIWLMTFITNEVEATNKDSARHMRFRFEDVLLQAETLGLFLQKFFRPLSVVAQNRALVEDIGDIIQTEKKFTWLTAERKIMRLAVKPDTTIFSTVYRYTDFNKLLVYSRRESQIWNKFSTLTEEEKVDIVSKGLMEISENLKNLQKMLKGPLRAIKAGERRRLSCLQPTLIPHVRHMREVIRKSVEKKEKRPSLAIDMDEDDEDRKILELFMEETGSHYDYILKYGELIVEEIWDIILMVRLCYTYIRENARNNLTVTSYDALIASKFKKKVRRKLLKPSQFDHEDFYRVDCGDTLRKLPIIISSINTELCLHLHGHRNSNKSKISNPLHKFSRKWNSQGTSKQNTADVGSEQDRKQLMFVSAGGGDLN